MAKKPQDIGNQSDNECMNECVNQSGHQSLLERHKSFLNLILEKICTGEKAPSSMKLF